MVEDSKYQLHTPSDILHRIQKYFDIDESGNIDKNHYIKKLETIISPELINTYLKRLNFQSIGRKIDINTDRKNILIKDVCKPYYAHLHPSGQRKCICKK